MAVVVVRTGSVVVAVAVENRRVTRSIECRNVQCAVTLEAKLTADSSFADRWVRDTESALPASVPDRQERQPG